MDFRKEFLEETDELLARLEKIVLSLERAPAERAQIDEAFRIAHTLKGSALSVEFGGFAAVAHRLEDILDQGRSSFGTGAQIQTEELLRFLDVLVAYARGLKQDPNFVLEANHLKRIEASVRSNTSTSATSIIPKPSLPAKGAGRSDKAEADLYYRAYLQSARMEPDEDALSLMADLSRLAVHAAGGATFSGIARDSFNNHPELRAISRVCLVRRLGLANHLEVVCSDGDASENLMPAGYRCFVSVDGSLFQLSPNQFRTFPSASRIVSCFASEGRRPPRPTHLNFRQEGWGTGAGN